jgi:ferredoxin--NADP+ reductase
MKAASDELGVPMMVHGRHALSQNPGEVLERENPLVVGIGPVPMMKRICEVTRPYGIKTQVSLNPIMITDRHAETAVGWW